jgi:hypothetical protein
MKKPVELYLKIPDRILGIRDLAPGEKMLLAHIYSFGVKGCWQSNQTLAKTFMTSPRAIQRWLAGIKNYIIVRHGKGYYRTIWAKSHPQLSQDRIDVDVRQNRQSNCDKDGIRLRQNCRTTINNTITENNERTIASPTPLPAAGQASATLEHRRQVAAEQIEKFKARLGRPAAWTPLTQEQFGRRRAEQLAALRATTDNR